MKRQSPIWLVLILMLCTVPAWAQIQMTNYVIGGGGGVCSGSSHGITGTAGQTAIGIVTGPDWYHEVGFWTASLVLTAVDDHVGLPTTFRLGQNYPNPFNPRTTIKYDVPKAATVRMRLYDIRGRLVRTLMDQDHTPGYFEYSLDGSDLSSGVYFYSIEAGSYSSTKKLVLLK